MLGLLAAAFVLAGCGSTAASLDVEAGDAARTVAERTGVPVAPRFDGRIPERAELESLLGPRLGEDGAVKLAVLNNPRVAAVFEEIGIDRGDLIQAGLLRNPVFDGNFKDFEAGTEIELTIAQSFLEVFFIPLRAKAARLELEATKAAVARHVICLVFDVRRAFVTVRAAEQEVAMRRQALAAAVASLELMQQLHEAGNATGLMLAGEEASAARARVDLANAEASALEAREPLNVLLGVWGKHAAWPLDAGSPLGDALGEGFDLAQVETRAIASSLDLAEARAHADAAAQRAGLERWEGAFSTGALGPAVKRESDDGWGPGAALSLDLPIFDQGQGRDARAAAALRQALHRHAAAAIEVRSAARLFRDRLRARHARAVYLRDVLVPARGRVTKETLRNYNAMQVGAFDVLLARQQELEAGGELIDSLREAWLARLDLEELLAGSLNRERVMAAPRDGEHEGMSMDPRRGH